MTEGGTYFLCRPKEAPYLIDKATVHSKKIIDELHILYPHVCIVINVFAREHLNGSSICGELMMTKEVVSTNDRNEDSVIGCELQKTYDPIDLCFLDLENVMFNQLLQGRSNDETN